MDAAAARTNEPPQTLRRWVMAAVIGRHPKWTLIRLAVLIVLSGLIYLLTPPIRISGISMEPTFHDRKINFVNKLAYAFKTPQRGDVVGIRLRPTDGIWYLKRVVGLPGEKIAFMRGKLYINEQPQDEPYVKTGCDWEMPAKLLGPDEYYVTGDNRGMAFDEHWHRAVSIKQIEGKIIFRGDLW